MGKLFSRYFLAIFLSVLSFSSTYAIKIDEFEGDQAANAGFFENQTSAIIAPLVVATGRNSAIGGSREFSVQGLTGSAFLKTRLATGLGFMSHSQDAGATGVSRVTWDGNNNTSVFDPNGLGGVNFNQDGGSAIDVGVLSFDAPAGNSVTLQLIIWGADNKASTASMTLSSEINTLTNLSFPFSSFVRYTGASSDVDWSKVGAIQLIIFGYAEDVDLRLEYIETNTSCKITPDSNLKVLDLCGVCGGDDSSCKDCLGVPNGSAVAGTTCSSSGKGICQAGKFNVSCGCESNNKPSVEICDSLDNDCDGSIDEDYIGLGGSCSDGTGLCKFNGTLVCASIGGMACEIPSFTTKVAACESSKGCDGIPNSGLKVDLCGVCGGNNSTCSDCKGVPFGSAIKDRCGVCNGDGSSCLNCNTVEQSALLRSLDGGAKAQERLIIKVLRQLSPLRKDPKAKLWIQRAYKKAHDLQIGNWTISWTLPATAITCTNQVFCARSSNLGTLDEYRTNALELRDLGIEVVRKLIVAQGNKVSKMSKDFTSGAYTLYEKNMKLADSVPTFQSSCTSSSK